MKKKLINRLYSKSPIKIRKRLIYKYDVNEFKNIDMSFKNDISFEYIDEFSTDKYEWLKEHKDLFAIHLKNGYTGFLGLSKDKTECYFYGWLSVNVPPGNGIPSIPQNSAWIFNDFVNKKYRGKGYQKLIHLFRINYLMNKCNVKNIYVDSMPSNIPAIKNTKAVGFKGAGIYYIFIFGIRRYKYLHLILNYWSNSKHPKQY